jgi:hypothetical protein
VIAGRDRERFRRSAYALPPKKRTQSQGIGI